MFSRYSVRIISRIGVLVAEGELHVLLLQHLDLSLWSILLIPQRCSDMIPSFLKFTKACLVAQHVVNPGEVPPALEKEFVFCFLIECSMNINQVPFV